MSVNCCGGFITINDSWYLANFQEPSKRIGGGTTTTAPTPDTQITNFESFMTTTYDKKTWDHTIKHSSSFFGSSSKEEYKFYEKYYMEKKSLSSLTINVAFETQTNCYTNDSTNEWLVRICRRMLKS